MSTLCKSIPIAFLMTLEMSFAWAQSPPTAGLWEMTTTLDTIHRQSPQGGFAETTPSASGPTVNGPTVVTQSPIQMKTGETKGMYVAGSD